MKKIIFSLSLIALLSGISFSQQIIGKIYSIPEADSLYGTVLNSVIISSNYLTDLLKNSDNYIMFRIEKDTPIIADNNRNCLSPAGLAVNSTDVFRIFSTSLVAQLLQDGGEAVTYIESRNKGVLSISNGIYTLEYGVLCPPYCN